MGATTTPHIVHCPLSKIKKKKGSKGMQFPCKIVKVFTLLRILRLLQHSTSVRCVLRPCLKTVHMSKDRAALKTAETLRLCADLRL